MKNILLVSDAFTNGGLETRIQEQINEYKKHNKNVFLACKDFNNNHSSNFKDILLINDLQIPNSDSLDIKNVISTRDQIIRFCKKNTIDIIECHPFWCILPAVLASEKLSTPITFTLHGPASSNFINPNHTNLCAVYYLATKYGVDQIFAAAKYLEELYSYLSLNIIVAKNTIKLLPNTNGTVDYGNFCIASRIDLPKTKLIMDFLPSLQDSPLTKKIDIFGDGDQKEVLLDFIKQNKLSKVSLCGWKNNLNEFLSSSGYEAVIGMGRVILDAISSNIPAGILGYGGFAGFLNHDNYQYFANNNLTDWTSYPDINITKEIKNIREHRKDYILTNKERSCFDSEKNWPEYLKILESITFSEKPIVHIINSVFEKNTSTNFNLNNLVTDIQVHHVKNDIVLQSFINTIDVIKKKDAEINDLKSELNQITNSRFWKSTKPVRKVLNKLH